MTPTQPSLPPHMLERIFERCPSLISVYNLSEQRVIYANRGFASLLGYNAEQTATSSHGMDTITHLIHPDDLARLQTHRQSLQEASDETVLEIEYRMRHQDGSWRWLLSRDTPYQRGANEQLLDYVSVIEDITARHNALEWSQHAIGIVPLLVYVYSFTQGNMYANQQLGDMLGYTTQQVQDLGVSFLPTTIHPDDLAKLPAIHEQLRAASDTDTVPFTYRIRHADGQWRVLEDNMRVFRRDDQQNVLEYLGATQDVTGRVRAEKEREELLIAYQQHQNTLRELSTPLIPVSDDVLVLPLIGTIDSMRARQVLETLLAGVAARQVSTVIVDITGVLVVDTQVANVLLRAAQAVRLLGAQTVLTGIRPEVAQTLVQLGADLSAIVTRATLQSGISYALRTRMK